RRIADDGQSAFMRGTADAGNVQHMTVRIAGAFEIDIDVPAGFETRSAFVFRGSQCLPEVLRGEAVEPAHRCIKFGAIALPIVEDRVGSARGAGTIAGGQGLIGDAHWRLQRVEYLGELKACKSLGVEPGHPILAVETAQRVESDG